MLLEEMTRPIQNRHEVKDARDNVYEVMVDNPVLHACKRGDDAESCNDEKKESESKSLEVMSYICHSYHVLNVVP